tara:strand:- start:342 stop:1103 length:762 start_codon:yes stop_codon:yes gene_type:complete
MKTLILLLVFCLVATCNAELRTWTSIVGTKIEAELVALTGNQVTLKTAAGKTLKLPLNKLSKADQQFLTAKSSLREPAKEEIPVDPNLKYEVKDSAVTISKCDKKASGTITIPATIEGKRVISIGDYAFSGCESLTKITIPDSVISIGNSAFFQCNSLISITIPDNVTSIGSHVFYNCTNLTSVMIGNGITSISKLASKSCRSLTEVTFLGDAPKEGPYIFNDSSPIIYRKPEAKGWGDTWGGRPVQLTSEKP